MHTQSLPALIRLAQILGDKKRGIEPIVPVSRSGWYVGMKDGRFPQPVRLGPNSVAWRKEDILALVKGGA